MKAVAVLIALAAALGVPAATQRDPQITLESTIVDFMARHAIAGGVVAAGPAHSAPMIEKRKRAHRSRCRGSDDWVKGVSRKVRRRRHRHRERRLRTWRDGGYVHPLREITGPHEKAIGRTVIGARNTSSRSSASAASPTKRPSKSPAFPPKTHGQPSNSIIHYCGNRTRPISTI